MDEETKQIDELAVAEAPQKPLLEMVPPQEAFDREIVGQNIGAARRALAEAKLKYHASRAGIPDTGGHPNQHKADCVKAAAILATMEGYAVDGLPMPSALEVAALVPPTELVPASGA